MHTCANLLCPTWRFLSVNTFTLRGFNQAPMHAQPLLNPTRPYSAPLGPTLSHLALPVSEYFHFKRI